MNLIARRAAEADAGLLLEWRNDDATRRASRSTDPVTPEEHRRWLRATLADDDRMLLVVEGEEPVGTVRWDRVDERSWELSITLAPAARGRGLARAVLAAGEEALSEESPRRLLAVVREENEAAQRLFRSAGYRPTGVATDGLLVMVKPVVPA